MSFTILPFTTPYTREAQDALNMQSAFLAQTNTFSVPQNFSGIVNSGSGAMVSLAVSGNASIVGSLNAGATTVSSLVISGAGADSAAFTANSLAVTNLATFNGGYVNNGAGSISTTLSVGGLLSANGGLNCSAGAVSIVPASSFTGPISAVSQSLSGALTVVGVSTLGVVNSGAYNASGLVSANAGLSVQGAVSMPASSFSGPITGTSAVFSGAIQCASEIDTGSLTCATLSASGLVSANAGLSVVGLSNFGGAINGTSAVFSGAIQCASEIDTGALTCVAVSASGLVSANAGLTVVGTTTLALLVLPVTQQGLSVVSGVLSVPGNWVSCATYYLPLTSNITSAGFSGMIVNASLDIYLVGDNVARTVSKVLSTNIKTNLSGNTTIAANSIWLIRCKCVSASLVVMDWTNFT